MRLGNDILTSAGYIVDIEGESSKRFLDLMNEDFDAEALAKLRDVSNQLSLRALQSEWSEALLELNPAYLEKFSTISFFRMYPSVTHRSKTEGSATEAIPAEKRETWLKACLMVNQWIKDEVQPDLDKVCQLNAVFGHKIRNHKLKERYRCFDPIDLERALASFDPWLRRQQKAWGVQVATLACSFFIEVHPFENGNGRTARLLLDWLLGLHNLPAPSFTNKYDALLSRAPATEESLARGRLLDVPHHRAVERVLKGVEKTLLILEGGSLL